MRLVLLELRGAGGLLEPQQGDLYAGRHGRQIGGLKAGDTDYLIDVEAEA